MRQYIVPVLALSVTVLAGYRGHTLLLEPAPDETDIRAARLAQNAAIAAHDLDSAATFWTPQVLVTAGLGTTLQGREAYKAAFSHDAGFRYERTPTSIAVSANWPLASEQGTWAGHREGVQGPVIQGQYTAMWVKGGGRWRIRSELFVALTCASHACAWPVDTGSP
jgi:ketosteroid isomerase-like protein